MLIRRITPYLLLGLLVISCQSSKNDNIDVDKTKTQLSNHANDFMMGLKSVLISNMKDGGPVNAVTVCADTAEQLTNMYSESMGVTVKRFSFKNRNINNTPDSFEEKALINFKELHKTGQLTDKSHVFEVTKDDVAKIVKPIMVGAPCLTCHGDKNQIDAEVAGIIMKKYPDDKAFGYKIGDLRGAISVSKIL